MKIDFYHEALAPKFVRFTFIGIQINKLEDTGEWYVSIGLLGAYVAIIL